MRKPGRVFCDSSFLILCFAEDDPPRAFAAAGLIESDATLVISTGVILEVVHVLRTKHGVGNPRVGEGLIRFLTREQVELVDADRARAGAGPQGAAGGPRRRPPAGVSRGSPSRGRHRKNESRAGSACSGCPPGSPKSRSRSSGVRTCRAATRDERPGAPGPRPPS